MKKQAKNTRKRLILLVILICLLILSLLINISIIKRNISCPKEIKEDLNFPDKITCEKEKIIIVDEKATIWSVHYPSNGLSFRLPEIILERTENNTKRYYDLTKRFSTDIFTRQTFGIDFVSYHMSLEGLQGLCLTEKRPPYLRLNQDSTKERVFFEKKGENIYLNSNIDYQIDRNGCVIKGNVSLGLTNNDTNTNLTAYYTKPFTYEYCELLKEKDECFCTFVLWNEGDNSLNYLNNSLRTLNKISNPQLKKDCKEQMYFRINSSSMRYPKEYGVMKDKILPLLQQVYLEDILNRDLEFIPKPIVSNYSIQKINKIDNTEMIVKRITNNDVMIEKEIEFSFCQINEKLVWLNNDNNTISITFRVNDYSEEHKKCFYKVNINITDVADRGYNFNFVSSVKVH
jgi:hypothetical protein